MTLAASLLVGCGLDVDYRRLRDHVIACDANGQVYDPETDEVMSPEQRRAHMLRILARSDEVCEARANPVRKILIHVHGGLNTQRTSLEAADLNIRRMLDDPDEWHYPIFVTWDSGLVRSYGKYLVNMRHGRNAKYWGWPTAPLYLVTDLASAVAGLPKLWTFQLATDIAHGAAVGFGAKLLPSWINASTAYGALPPERKNLPCPDSDFVRAKLGDYSRGGWRQAGRFVLYLATLAPKLATSLFVGQGIGQGSWEGMLHSASNLFYTYDEFDLRTGPRDPDTVRRKLLGEPQGAFAEFLRILVEHVREHDEDGHVHEITLVCHSMGAIIVSDALQLLSQQSSAKPGRDGESALPITNLVYMAAACSVKHAADSVVPYLLANERTKFHVLTLHPSAEVDEINALDLPPRGSLLEWIDSFYTRVANPQDRRLGKWVNVMQSLHMFRAVAPRMQVKGFGVDGDSKPAKHGQFNDCPFWKAEFWDPDGPMSYR